MTMQAQGPSGGRRDDDQSQDLDEEELTSPGGAAASGVRGFSAQLRGVSLWDLVQMECLARSRLAVRVVGDGGVGYLYFDGGRILHAVTAQRTGEAAAIEILGWTNGSFQPSDRAWPERPTIATSHEALILQVAQVRDESGASNLVAFPRGGGGAETIDDVELMEVSEGDMRNSNSNEVVPPPKPPRVDAGSSDYAVMMRLGPNGSVVTNRGGSEDFAETIAYAERLVQLAGELLGLEAFSALECTFVNGRCIMFTEGEGEIVALRPRPDVNLQPLRERLGL
jgi:hypothetical protein